MKRFVYSLIVGSLLPCVLYVVGRNTTSSGPEYGAWTRITEWVVVPGYFLVAGLFPMGQRVASILAILFDCLLWSLAVLVLWEAVGRIWLAVKRRSRRAA